MKLSPRRSKGALLLASTGSTREALASRLGIAGSYVTMLQNGQRKPGLELRKLMLELLKIPIPCWDEAPDEAPENGANGHTNGAAEPPKEEGTAPRDWGVKSAATRLEWLEQLASGLGEEVRNTRGHTLGERAKAAKELALLEDRIRKLRGEELPETMLMKTARWKAIEETLFEALKPYPEAMRAAGEALLALDRRQR